MSKQNKIFKNGKSNKITKKLTKKLTKKPTSNPTNKLTKGIVKPLKTGITIEDADFANLIKIVETSTRKKLIAREFNGKLVANIANFGGKKGNHVKLQRNGEYYGIGVELLEDVKQLLTDKLVIRILKLLGQENYSTPLNILGLTSLDELQYILHMWLEHACDQYDHSLENYKKAYPVYNDWIKTVRSDALPGKVKITDIGFNEKTGGSVLPTDWIDREFVNGAAVHDEMNKLETRTGKPPATYAIIYTMEIQKQDTIITDMSKISFEIVCYINFVNGKFTSEIVCGSKTKLRKCSYVKYDKMLIGFNIDDILVPKKTNSKLHEVSILVSRLQKCIRRGKQAAFVLNKTIDELNESPNYNLPEHGFMRVSASKQLVWRLFISILEDCRPYAVDKSSPELSLLDLILLVLITQKCSEYKFNANVLESIKITALLAQYNDTKKDLFNWRKLPESESICLNVKSHYHAAITLALDNIIMMSGDRRMLKKLCSAKDKFNVFARPVTKNLTPNSFKLSDNETCQDVILSSIDHHCKPSIILLYQACIPVSMSTREISKYIWDTSSSHNIRSKKTNQKSDLILRQIQGFFHEECDIPPESTEIKPCTITKIKPNICVSRSSFLILFGFKYRNKQRDVILAGTIEKPARVKIANEWTFSNDKTILNAYPKRYVDVSKINPPFGFQWTKKKYFTEIIDGKPYVDNVKIDFFNASDVLISTIPNVETNCNSKTRKLVVNVLSGLDLDFTTILNLRTSGKNQIVNWVPSKSDSDKLDLNLIKCVYTKLFNQYNNIITIGPCDRSGNKMHNSINYYLEGKIWAVMNLLHYLYPDTIIPTQLLNFRINNTTQGYVHMTSSLREILFSNTKITGSPLFPRSQKNKVIPKIITKLWDHQQETVNTILTGFKSGRHGFGDASDVGSGKTLTSISIAVQLIERETITHSAIIVLLPGNKLIDTWRQELEKHTQNFDVKYHKPSGDIGTINRNTIVISTMARIRENPIDHPWLLVVIDECLSVQNKNALQTEQAFIQSLMSKYLLMMSATFFRTRFDKLYYMLKMLQSGLPEQRQYLDAILVETIVSKIPINNRKWTSNTNYFELDSITRKEYDKINSKNISDEIKYSKLISYLTNNSQVNDLIVLQLKKLIKNLEKQQRKCLIYARSKTEANLWSEKLNIPIYPEKGDHCITTYHDGTYGLNDLVIYDTIVMRPPNPDSLQQIKGRLNRHGQKCNDLFIEYFFLKNTIEEGLMIRLNIASNFVHQYIMPLAKFYKVSVNHGNYI
ncbi:helicase [Cotonvirus japonicus]|uniref:Helicase n=1 Tax=Cotonvirus japonicus TaxID=2811091 RepID=A0ABM7NRF1_9VIRU|nr:helicase [Cotonvirus japonicus]BCS82730.1 helicase [Cotonvirus japonicus]